MVGVKRGRVRVVPYQESWIEWYAAEVERVRRVGGGRFLEFEHIGSTAIPGMPAKPIIDVLAVVTRLDEAMDLVPVLEGCGYEYRPRDAVPDRELFAKGPPWRRTCHLSVTERDSGFYRDKLAFRDYLRSHPDVAAEYAALKRRLAAQYPRNRRAYTAGKAEFIEDVLDRALAD